MDFPAMGARGFPGNLVEAKREGMKMSTLAKKSSPHRALMRALGKIYHHSPILVKALKWDCEQ
jgi:hypothetical protein